MSNGGIGCSNSTPETTEVSSAGKPLGQGSARRRDTKNLSASCRDFSASAVVFRGLDSGAMPQKIHRRATTGVSEY